MVTGIEVCGLALAILPLLVNQIDGYVQGCDRLSSLRGKKYRARYESWKLALGTQQRLLQNTLQNLLEDENNIDEVRKFFQDSRKSGGWDIEDLDTALQAKLGDSYAVFLGNLIVFNDTLTRLQASLGFQSDLEKQVNWESIDVFKLQFRKFRDILKESIYRSLLDQVTAINSSLDRLAQQAQQTQARSIAFSKSAKFRLFDTGRARAISLYETLVSERCWPCTTSHSHSFNYFLPQAKAQSNDLEVNQSEIRLRGRCDGAILNEQYWLTASSCSIKIQQPSIAKADQGSVPTTMNNQKPKKAINFQLPLRKNSGGSKPATKVTAAACAVNLCTWVSSVHKNQQPTPASVRDTLGGWQHSIYPDDKGDKLISKLSLHEVLSRACDYKTSQTPTSAISFAPRQRIHTATVISVAAFVLQGTWLDDNWSSSHVNFDVDTDSAPDPAHTIKNSRLYIHNTIGETRNKSSYPVSITSPTLLALGCTLVELSLRKPLEELKCPEDERPTLHETRMMTARRLLPEVLSMGGPAFHDVAWTCLYEPEKSCGEGLADEDFRRKVFDLVVGPMMEINHVWNSVKFRQ